MRILYIHQYYKHIEEPGAHRSYYISKKLQEKGHQVIVLTSNTSNPQWKFIERRKINGVEVWFSGWAKESKQGKKWISLAFTPKLPQSQTQEQYNANQQQTGGFNAPNYSNNSTPSTPF